VLLAFVTIAATPSSCKPISEGLHLVGRWDKRSRALKTISGEVSHFLYSVWPTATRSREFSSYLAAGVFAALGIQPQAQVEQPVADSAL
jgi:hypothetical protein